MSRNVALRPEVASPPRHGPSPNPKWPRAVGAVVLIAHGLVHLMGPALLWHLAEPGSLRFDQVRPAAGSTAAIAIGTGWLAAAVLFVAAGIVLASARRGWLPVTAAAALLSAAVIAPSVSVAIAGLLVDAVLSAAVLGFAVVRVAVRRHRAMPAGRAS